MNNTYKTNKTDWRRLVRSVLFVALLLGASLPAQAADYVFLYNSEGTFHILSNTSNTITDVTTFSYTNCVWSGTNGSTFSNQGRYLYWTSNNAVWTANTSGDNLTINNNKIYNYYNRNNYYIRYNNNQWVSSTTNSQNEVVYQISTQTDNSLSTPTIASDDFVFTDLTSHIYSASATYTYKLYKLAGASNYYVVEGGTPSTSTTAPTTTDGITYVWSLSDGTTDNGHVRINPSTGDVTYYNAYTDANHTVGIKVTATHSASGLSQTSSTKNITVNKLTAVNPTGITATDITVSQGNTITATNYTTTATLSAGQYPYSHVTATSDATDIATVANVGDGFTITGVAVGSATITIKAYNIGNSVVACSTTFTVTVTEPETGISGSIVILNDYEDHSWAYYSDPQCPIRSLNPADVKITYYGDGIVMTGNADYTASSTDFVKPGQTNYTGGAKVNVGGEDENTFVYYKTLERTDGSTSANPTGRCAYTTIPNPFQVRPTYGTPPNSNRAAWTGWRGFQCWRLKSFTGGAVYSAASGGTALAVGAIINGETQIYFAPTSEYGMAVALEAVWARAYLVYANGNGDWSVPDHADLGYERNFVVLSSEKDFFFGGGAATNSNANITNINRPSTISPYLPNGTSGNEQIGNVQGVYANNANNRPITLQANTKFENVKFVNMSGNNLTADGHSLIIGRGCNGTVNYIRGLAQGTATTNYWGQVTSVDYKDYSSNLNYTIRIESGTINYLSFLAGYNATDNTSSDAYTRCTGTSNLVKGVLGCDYDRAKGETNNGNDNLTITRSVFYGNRVTMASQNASQKTFDLHVKSGKFLTDLNNNMGTGDASQSMYMSIASYGENTKTGERKVTIEGGEMCNIAGGVDVNQDGDNHVRSLTLRMTGGTVKGAIYGGGAVSPAWGDRWMVFTGGTVKGWIGAGCNGVTGGNSTTGGQTNGESFVYVGGLTNVGGSSAINGSDGGTVFGAGKGSGSNSEPESGKMSYGTNLVIADQSDILNNVYGGGNFGFSNEYTNLHILGGTVHGDIFGGSNQNKGPNIDIIMKAGTINGGLYGGCNTSGDISGHINIDIYGTDPAPAANAYAVGQVFGGGNVAAYTGTPVVTVHNDSSCNISIGEVYGGGNQATVTGTNVTIEAGNIIGDVYGGGRQAAVGNGGTSVTVNGGTIRRVFGGNNISGAIADGTAGKIVVNVDKTASCPMKIGQVFGGGNQAGSQVGRITVGCTGDLVTPLADGQRYGYDQEGIGAVYGGANEADIDGNITLNIVSGIVDSVFGGNNAGGAIDGDITVNINKNGSAPCANHWYVGYVFGGGNNATYSQKTADHPAVNVQAGLVTHHVFGGGNGSGATVTGNPTVTLSGTAQVGGNVFGGGNAAAVSGNTSVKLQN